MFSRYDSRSCPNRGPHADDALLPLVVVSLSLSRARDHSRSEYDRGVSLCLASSGLVRAGFLLVEPLHLSSRSGLTRTTGRSLQVNTFSPEGRLFQGESLPPPLRSAPLRSFRR